MDTNAVLYQDLERVLLTREEIGKAVKELGEKIRQLKTNPGCPIAKYQCSRNREQRKQR